MHAGPQEGTAAGLGDALTYRLYMRRALFLLAPRWLALHLAVVAACVAMVLLGRWQWHVAHVRHGAVQNYAYAFQWWAFTAFALLMWARVIRDAPHRERPVGATHVAVEEAPASPAQPVAYRRYVMPSSADRPPGGDAELSAYNAYLAELAQRSDADREDA